jgi:hypothetical protein
MLDFDVWDVEELEGAPFFPSQNEQNQNWTDWINVMLKQNKECPVLVLM